MVGAAVRIGSLRGAIDRAAQSEQRARFDAGCGASTHFSAEFDCRGNQVGVASNGIRVRLQTDLQMPAAFDDVTREGLSVDEQRGTR